MRVYEAEVETTPPSHWRAVLHCAIEHPGPAPPSQACSGITWSRGRVSADGSDGDDDDDDVDDDVGLGVDSGVGRNDIRESSEQKASGESRKVCLCVINCLL